MFRPTLFAIALLAAAPVLAQATTATTETTIKRAKIVANAEVEFAKVDGNKDGQMSRAEIESFQRITLTTRINTRNKAVFTALDADKNGQLSAAEFAKINGDPPKPDASEVLKIDTNKDDQISLAEHRNATLATFDRVDSNKDGILTAAEVKAMTAAPKK